MASFTIIESAVKTGLASYKLIIQHLCKQNPEMATQILKQMSKSEDDPRIVRRKHRAEQVAKFGKDKASINQAMKEYESKVNSGNKKRIESCKKVGGEKKQAGHQLEKDFLKKYNSDELDNPTEYGPTSDTTISTSHPICDILAETIYYSSLYVSNKSGKSIQFTLGQIPELNNVSIDTLNDKEFLSRLFNKYLKKNESAKPAGILAYKDDIRHKWIFFNMDDVVNYIVEKCVWRILDTGRIKGDFKDNSKKGIRQYLTYEYRPHPHKSYFLGVNGGRGIDFIHLLMNEIKYYEDFG